MIPLPEKILYKEGSFVINSKTQIFFDDELEEIVDFFIEFILNSTDKILERTSSKKDKECIIFEIDQTLSQLESEGYLLIVTIDFVRLTATSPHGIFNGLQSLRQLLPPECEKISFNKNTEWKIPCIKIEDKPRFKWRGVMLDVSRHYQEIKTIKHLLDLMGLMKMNVFHWHLTDDQGWRIDIKKYPKLTEKGSKRKDSKIVKHIGKKYRGKPHQGFYTREDILEIVRYAQERFITVIPEIEMPGHATAAIASHPELSCRKEILDVAIKPGIFSNIFCAGQEETFRFLEDVLEEVIFLFPSEIIHIGGDEVPKRRWKECSQCQRRMKNENIDEVQSLHHYFTDRIASFLKSKGIITMGWNEILHNKIDRNVIIHWWKMNKKQVMTHIQEGGNVVVSRFFRYYLDYNYIVTPLKKTYAFEPVPKDLDEKYYTNILGVEATIWTEWIPTIERLEWQVFPRLSAIAETGWSLRERRNYKDFRGRLSRFSKRLDFLGVQYAPLEEVDPSNWYRFWHLRNAFKWPKI
ncbi:MAG: beta-N-acetylhexosaminidase [Asgard group archaeon]|nr:beta-N-acetylhexosaminidase [Asgard group archaeon]